MCQHFPRLFTAPLDLGISLPYFTGKKTETQGAQGYTVKKLHTRDVVPASHTTLCFHYPVPPWFSDFGICQKHPKAGLNQTAGPHFPSSGSALWETKPENLQGLK